MEPRTESVGQALVRIVVARVVVPLLVLTAVFWGVRLLLPVLGVSAQDARGWAWGVVAVLGFVLTALGDSSPMGRILNSGDQVQAGRRWNGRDFEP